VSPVAGLWHLHMDGLIGMLKARGPAQFSSQKKKDFFWTMFSQAVGHPIDFLVHFPVFVFLPACAEGQIAHTLID
jgi:hypothetical protein